LVPLNQLGAWVSGPQGDIQAHKVFPLPPEKSLSLSPSPSLSLTQPVCIYLSPSAPQALSLSHSLTITSPRRALSLIHAPVSPSACIMRLRRDFCQHIELPSVVGTLQHFMRTTVHTV
jgi:hypothetical protein